MIHTRENSSVNPVFGTDRASTPTMQDAFAFLRRRKSLFVLVAFPILIGAVLLAFKLPAVYQSEAKVLIEQPSIPEDIVASTVNTYVDEQIQAVSQRVLAADNVAKLIDEFDLYPELRLEGINQSVIEQFRADTDLQNIAAEIFDARRGRMDGSTFAFIVGFRHTEPETAQNVTASLVQLYLDENVKSRTEISAETTRFLEQQAERIAIDISEMELRLSEFKAQYAGSLPERLPLNIQLLDRTERDMATMNDDIRQLAADRDVIQVALQGISPYATMVSDSGAPILGADERLGTLQLEYARLSSTYGPEHPDVVRVRGEIEAIIGSDATLSSDNIEVRLMTKRLERDQLRESYSNEHPDVVSIEREIATLESQLRNKVSTNQRARPAPNNPLYLQKQVELAGAEEKLRAAQRERTSLIERRDELEQNIALAPQVEKEWLELNRGYESTREEFDDINLRISEAQMSERLESQNKGQRFTLLETARLPNAPIEPNRSAIIFLGIVGAIAAGIGIAALVDGLDITVRSERDLELIIGANPLVAIPFVETASDRRIRILKQSALSGFLVLSIAAVVVLI